MNLQQVKQKDRVRFDLTKLSTNDRKLLSVVLGLYFEEKLNGEALLNIIKVWKLPIIV